MDIPGDSVINILLASAGDVGDASSISGSGSSLGEGRSPGEWMATHSGILAWRNPWTEEPVRLHSMRLQKSWARLGD